MKHLSFDDIVTYMNIDEDNYSPEEALQLERIGNHLDECEDCLKLYYKVTSTHNAAEFLIGEPIPLGKIEVSLTDALKENNVKSIAYAAIDEILDTVDDLSDDILDIAKRIMTGEIFIGKSIGMSPVSALSAARTTNIQEAAAKISFDSESCIVTLDTDAALMLNSEDTKARAVLVIGQNDNSVEIYSLVSKFGINTAKTKELKKGVYRIIVLQDDDTVIRGD